MPAFSDTSFIINQENHASAGFSLFRLALISIRRPHRGNGSRTFVEKATSTKLETKDRISVFSTIPPHLLTHKPKTRCPSFFSPFLSSIHINLSLNFHVQFRLSRLFRYVGRSGRGRMRLPYACAWRATHRSLAAACFVDHPLLTTTTSLSLSSLPTHPHTYSTSTESWQ